MKPLGLNEIREKYLSFFESKEHLRLPSFPLVPQNDVSLLLINSGMAPLKPYFTGKEVPPRKRVTTCQKCIRTPDIENVGKTARHGTFFEMLGNFSFGDYFKREATAWAWELVTKVLELPEDRLWVSIYQDDDEAFEIWTKEVGVSADRIVRLGKEDNFWEIGLGPCGPCSEIYFDRGIEKGCGKPDCSIACGCDRFIEFWNLVFTQFDRDEKGNYNRLANPNIDTGMGLERMACIMQGVDSLFEVDTIRSVLDYSAQKFDRKYGQDYKTDVSLRIIADHIRGTTFMVSDGVLPSNEGRGYVLRRLIRRAARQGRLMGMEQPFLYDVAGVVIENSKKAYPELAEKAAYIKKIIKSEEERFGETVEQGMQILTDYMNDLKAREQKTLSGENAFKLYDTYGFPPDLTREILDEQGMGFDEKGFDEKMKEQKEQGRASWQGGGEAGWDKNGMVELGKGISCLFTGYTSLKEEVRVAAIIKGSSPVESCGKGEQAAVILDTTPFYAESGGQVGDTGLLSGEEIEAIVNDTVKTGDGKIIHMVTIKDGILRKGSKVTAEVEIGRRLAIMRNHSATHLLQKALREVLGEHVTQAGSLVEPDRLRFDFNHFSPVEAKELEEIETKVNERILEGLEVCAEETTLEEARKKGAMALFGEKYGQKVRLVDMGSYSLELCGGCHVKNTSQIGLFKILSESGISAGVRRIEAITGFESIAYLKGLERNIRTFSEMLKTTPQDSIKKVETIISDIKKLTKENEMLKQKTAAENMDEIISGAVDIKGVKVVTASFDQLDAEGLRNIGDRIRAKLGCGVVVLASAKDEKVSLVVMASKDSIEKGVHAGNIIREAAGAVGGGGGGRPDMAQAGGKDVSKIGDALVRARKMVEDTVR